MTHYDALEVSPQASAEVIRAAYKSLMQRLHPDKHPGNTAVAERAAAIAQAYGVLSDPQQRARYDMSLRAPAAAALPRHPAPPRTAARQAAAGNWLAPALLVAVLLALAAGGYAWLGARTDPARELAEIRHAFTDPQLPEAQRRALHARKRQILAQQPALARAESQARAQSLVARTAPLMELPLVLRLSSPTATGVTLEWELTIPRASVLAGSFEPDNLLAHLERHRQRIVDELARRLAQEDALRLARPEGERELKRAMLASIAQSLGTDLAQEYPSTYFESPGRYGVVDVLLPDRFTLVQLNALR